MTDIAAESEQEAKPDLPLHDRLAINITVSSIAVRKLIDFATADHRPVADLAAEVELGTTWSGIGRHGTKNPRCLCNVRIHHGSSTKREHGEPATVVGAVEDGYG